MNLLDRRKLLKSGGRLGVGAALTAALRPSRALAQLPAPEPLHDAGVALVATTEASPWQTQEVFHPTFSWEMLNLNVDPERIDAGARTMQGFGACFNELGWTSLSALSAQDRDAVVRELFHPTEGARFTYCRMPIGTNDFATSAYSYDETDGDFGLKDFTSEHDRKTLIPFIHAAQRYQPGLRLWASPWTPPSWMKRNHFYAEAPGTPAMGFKDNGIRADQIGREGEDMFLQEPRYFEAYARYFGRFLDAYRQEGIRVGMVMPQNEFNSAQNFPSCTWTAEGLARFLERLGPEMRRRDVEIYFGTLERGNVKLLETVMAQRVAAQYVRGVGVQWAGKNALPALSREYPALSILQSEQECGDGRNAWSYASYCWQLMKLYFRNGVSGYMYWNIALDGTAKSTWGWPQNSLVTVDTTKKTFRYNHDFYLLKHLTHFVDVGASCVDVKGTCDDALAFRNPDGGVVVIMRNETARPQLVQVDCGRRVVTVRLPGDSVATLTLKT